MDVDTPMLAADHTTGSHHARERGTEPRSRSVDGADEDRLAGSDSVRGLRVAAVSALVVPSDATEKWREITPTIHKTSSTRSSGP